MNHLSGYTVIIATYERPEPLRRALASLQEQTFPPEKIILVDASRGSHSEAIAAPFRQKLAIDYVKATTLSSAQQRNQGLDRCETPFVVFLDDDAVLQPETMERLAQVFIEKGEGIGGVSARQIGFERAPARGWLWWYYRWQAGYAHTSYGAKLFGPAINCMPCYEDCSGELIPADWLSTCCVMYRSDLVRRERFPDFAGYSYMEDVHLSARIARGHALYVHAGAPFVHENAPSSFKRSRKAMVRQRLLNQRRVAQEILGQHGAIFELKFFMHRVVASIAVVRAHAPGWQEELAGLWT